MLMILWKAVRIMRLIDADKLIQEFEKNIETYESDEYEEGINTGIRWCTEDVANAPTVEAIPKEWIKKFINNVDGNYLYPEIIEFALQDMIDEWEKENAE